MVDFYKVREAIEDERMFKTTSDAGGLLVGNESMSVLIPNKHGDGTTRVAVYNKDEKVPEVIINELSYFGIIKGSNMKIYSYDCDALKARPEMVLSGRYNVYHGGGFIVLIELAE